MTKYLVKSQSQKYPTEFAGMTFKVKDKGNYRFNLKLETNKQLDPNWAQDKLRLVSLKCTGNNVTLKLPGREDFPLDFSEVYDLMCMLHLYDSLVNKEDHIIQVQQIK